MVDTFTSPRRGNSGEVARLAELLKKNGPRGPTPLAYRIRQLTGRLRKVPPVVGMCCDLCGPQIYEWIFHTKPEFPIYVFSTWCMLVMIYF